MNNEPHQEKPAESPFDYSQHNQPESAEPAETPTGNVFDFGEYEAGQKTLEEVTEEINEHNRLTKTYDFSEENIATGGPVQRELTPDEIEENRKQAQAAEQSAQSKSKFGSGVIGNIFRRG